MTSGAGARRVNAVPEKWAQRWHPVDVGRVPDIAVHGQQRGWGQSLSIQIWAPPHIAYVALGKLLNLSVLLIEEWW